MQTTTKTVWYIVDSNNDHRLTYYKTRAGARIAQRLRNRHLGWELRVERVVEDDREYELCVNSNMDMETATYYIVEDSIECVECVDE